MGYHDGGIHGGIVQYSYGIIVVAMERGERGGGREGEGEKEGGREGGREIEMWYYNYCTLFVAPSLDLLHSDQHSHLLHIQASPAHVPLPVMV